MKIKIDFTESQHLWLLGRTHAVEGNGHRILLFSPGMELILPTPYLPLLVTWPQSHKLDIPKETTDTESFHTKGKSHRCIKKYIYPAKTFYLLLGGRWGRRLGLVFSPIMPVSSESYVRGKVWAPARQWGVLLKTDFFPLEKEWSACFIRPIYKCLHIILTIYLKSWDHIYFISETMAGLFSARGPLFFPLNPTLKYYSHKLGTVQRKTYQKPLKLWVWEISILRHREGRGPTVNHTAR